MRNLSILLLLVFLLADGCKSGKQVITRNVNQPPPSPSSKFSDQSTWVLGYFVRDQITRAPHSEWFIKGYDEYVINQEALDKLMKIQNEGISIKIVLGTWCPDSRKQVPRFMRIADAWKFPPAGITYIGVDDAKLSPVGEYESLNIQRVPTFIFYINNIEAGRIIENPVTSLEQDMVNILSKKD